MINVPISEELTYCGAYPWSCTPLPAQMILSYLPHLLVLVVLAFVLVIVIYITGKLIKRPTNIKKILLSVISFISIIFTLALIRMIVLVGPSLIFNFDVLNCVLRNAPPECYEFAAMHDTKNNDFSNSLKICNLTHDSSQCKVNVCENLTNSDTDEEGVLEKKCKDSVVKTCPNGYILNNIPCACDVPAGPYAVYDKQWLDDYWNKYRKGDVFEYCCNGHQQDKSCIQ